MLGCSYTSICSGCDGLLRPEDESRQFKLDDFSAQTGWGPAHLVRWVGIANGGLRDRVDLMLEEHDGRTKIGLFNRFRSGLIDLQGCPQLSPSLETWFTEFRAHVPDLAREVRRGSVRLRISPTGKRGVWLDFANTDIKRLLDEKTALRELMNVAIVEIGQRRKRLIEREDGQLKLADPVLEPWFESYVRDADGVEKPIPLFCTIGSFTQPGFRANRALVNEVRTRVASVEADRVAEFGSGIGNFTLPLASVSGHVDAYEVDELALQGLSRSLVETRWPTERVQIHAGNFQAVRKVPVDFRGADLIFADPPRSGLMNFLNPLADLAPAARPRAFVYVSCFTESFAADARTLAGLGYAPESAAIVDQFPQSRHYEIVASFRRR